MNAMEFCAWLRGFLDAVECDTLDSSQITKVRTNLAAVMAKPKPKDGKAAIFYHFCYTLGLMLANNIKLDVVPLKLNLSACFTEDEKPARTTPIYEGMTLDERMATGLFKGGGCRDVATRAPDNLRNGGY